jgi:radical SAM protein with 4Fe4S-binding SPASM domain
LTAAAHQAFGTSLEHSSLSPRRPTRKPLTELTVDGYYNVVRTRPWRDIHNAIRSWRHQWRYGVKSTFMFRTVELEINSMCNRRCSYCPNALATRPTGHLDEPLFTKIIDELASMDFDGIVSYHFYGEPLLDRRLPGFVAYTARHVRRCKPVIYSNGDLLTLEILREYIEQGLYTFWITQHDNRIPPNLQRIVAEATADEKRHINIHFANDLYLTNRSGLIPALGVPAAPLAVPCDWPLNTLVITATGNVVVCCNDYFETEVVGNVVTQSLRDVWCGERFERFRRALASGDRTTSSLCEKCDYIPEQSALHRLIPW